MLLRCSPVLFLLLSATTVYGQALVPPYNAGYNLTNLGSAPGVPSPYGGLCFLNNNTLLLGGNSDVAAGAIYKVPVVRGAGNHITGFGAASSFYKNAPFIDGGLAFGTGGVLFATTCESINPGGPNSNNLLQYKPGSPSLNPDKSIHLTPLGVNPPSTGAVQFVPPGFPGVGGIRILVYGGPVAVGGGQIYSANLTPDGLGTYNVGGVTLQVSLGAPAPWPGLEGIIYVPAGSPVFNPAKQYALVCDYQLNQIVAYQLDVNGYPIPATQALFITGLTGPQGACQDPVTNDFLFSTFAFVGPTQVFVVSGFPPPPPPPPPPPVLPPSLAPGGGGGEGSYAGTQDPAQSGSEGSFGQGDHVMANAGLPVLAGPFLDAPDVLVSPGFASAPPAGSRSHVFNISGKVEGAGQKVASSGDSTVGLAALAVLGLAVAVVLAKTTLALSASLADSEAA